MDEDLRDLLALWLGDHDPGATRRDALLSRLRHDETFRRTFLEEIRLLGMLRAVQSSEPRWLRLEDEIGWSARQHEDIEALAQKVVQQGRRIRHRATRLWAAAAAAAVLVAAGLFFLARRSDRATPHAASPPPEVEPLPARVELATVIRVEGVLGGPGESTVPSQGDVVHAGRLRLRSGRLTLAFFSGVSLTIEGPADLELLSTNRVFCHHGKFRARVPRGAEGFTILACGYEVLDLGTEFALNLEPGGKSRVMVFQGEAAVSVLGKEGYSVQGALLAGPQAVEVDPDGGHIQQIAPRPEAFVPLAEFVPPTLDLAWNYPAQVLAARPWGYWRFQTLTDNRVANEVAGRPPLKVLGSVGLEGAADGNRWARFQPADRSQALLMDGEWVPDRQAGYAIEAWVQADLPSPGAFGQTALVSLLARENGWTDKHVAYLELTARGRRSPHEPCSVRFLDRWPPGVSGGVDVFSRRSVVPSLWHHVVGQKRGAMLELYVDGECVGTSPARLHAAATDIPATTPCRLLVGRLKQHSLLRPAEIRPFEGRLDELAVYDHPLTPEEIRRHAQARTAKVGP